MRNDNKRDLFFVLGAIIIVFFLITLKGYLIGNPHPAPEPVPAPTIFPTDTSYPEVPQPFKDCASYAAAHPDVETGCE